MIHLQKKTIEGEVINIDGSDANYLGPDLILKNCKIILSTTSKALTIMKTRIADCQVQAKKKFTNFNWCDAFLEGCDFSGTFSGCDFGNWPQYHDPEGGIRSCDLSKAILDGCRFINCDIETIVLPTWPCFTILDPVKRISEMGALVWPAKTGLLAESFSNFPEKTVAVAFYSKEIVKKLGGTDEELKSALQKLGGVKF